VLVAECCLTPTHLNSADNLLPSCYFLTHCTVPAALLLSNSGPKENSVCPPLQVLNRRVDVALRDVVSGCGGDGFMLDLNLEVFSNLNGSIWSNIAETQKNLSQFTARHQNTRLLLKFLYSV